MFKKLITAVALSSALVAGLTACGGTSGAPSSDSTPAAHTSSAPAKTPASQNAKFGQSYKWSDGVEVTISAPTPYTPTAAAAGAVAGDQNVVFKITLTNGSKANIDPSIANLSLNSGGVAASNIIDLMNSAFNVPQAPVLPGQSISWSLAYSVKDASSLTGQFDLDDLTHSAAVFTN